MKPLYMIFTKQISTTAILLPVMSDVEGMMLTLSQRAIYVGYPHLTLSISPYVHL